MNTHSYQIKSFYRTLLKTSLLLLLGLSSTSLNTSILLLDPSDHCEAGSVQRLNYEQEIENLIIQRDQEYTKAGEGSENEKNNTTSFLMSLIEKGKLEHLLRGVEYIGIKRATKQKISVIFGGCIDLNKQNKEGDTILMLCVKNWSYRISWFICKHYLKEKKEILFVPDFNLLIQNQKKQTVFDILKEKTEVLKKSLEEKKKKLNHSYGYLYFTHLIRLKGHNALFKNLKGLNAFARQKTEAIELLKNQLCDQAELPEPIALIIIEYLYGSSLQDFWKRCALYDQAIASLDEYFPIKIESPYRANQCSAKINPCCTIL